MTALTPRWYQQEAIDTTIDFLFNDQGNGTLMVPTAGGKSLIMAEIAKRVYDIAPSHQIIMLTDVTALIGQNKDELLGQWPTAKTSVFSASYNSKNHHGEVVFCGIQSVYNKTELFDNVSVIIIDEIHRASTNEGSMYHKFVEGIKKQNPYVRIIGLSGTPWKEDKGSLEGSFLCDKIIYEIKMKTLFKEGFLCPLVTPQTKVNANVEQIKITSGGEYDENEMAKLFDDDYLVRSALTEAMPYLQNRNSCLIFACNVHHAETIQRVLKEDFGEDSEVVIGETDTKERRRIFESFRNFESKFLISVGVLTTGFNIKSIDAGIILRATKSSSLWLQIVGRFLRTHPSKTDAIVLDFGKNVENFGPIDKISAPPTPAQRKQAKKTPFKTCSSCDKIISFLAKECEHCGTEFESLAVAPNHGSQLSTESLTGEQHQIYDKVVDNVSFRRHTSSRSGLKSLQITYLCGIEKIREYYHFDGENYQRAQACKWWYKMAHPNVASQCPQHLDTALAELKMYGINKPSKIQVDYTNCKKTKSGEWMGHKILRYY